MKRWRQQALTFRTRGGRRKGAGRKPSAGRRGVPHRFRPEHRKEHPVHVTLRASRRLPSLRKQRIFEAVRRSLGRTVRTWFRIVHYSVQADHVHLLVEALDKNSLSRGLMGATIRLARAVNRVLKRRGSVWSDRYHARALHTPREVRHGMVYVLMNWKKHLPGVTGLDPCSSAWSFTDWCVPPPIGPPDGSLDAAVQRPTTWLLRTGWKRRGLIDPAERPRTSS